MIKATGGLISEGRFQTDGKTKPLNDAQEYWHNLNYVRDLEREQKSRTEYEQSIIEQLCWFINPELMQEVDKSKKAKEELEKVKARVERRQSNQLVQEEPKVSQSTTESPDDPSDQATLESSQENRFEKNYEQIERHMRARGLL